VIREKWTHRLLWTILILCVVLGTAIVIMLGLLCWWLIEVLADIADAFHG
jgi:hypothetical protein